MTGFAERFLTSDVTFATLSRDAETDPALLNVRAGNIKLDDVHIGAGQPFRDFTVLLDSAARDIRDYGGILLFSHGR